MKSKGVPSSCFSYMKGLGSHLLKYIRKSRELFDFGLLIDLKRATAKLYACKREEKFLLD